MDTKIKMRITKGKIPMFRLSYEFIKFVDMPNFETFKFIYCKKQNYVNEDRLNLYYDVLKTRYEGESFREIGRQINKSVNRVRQIEQRFLRNLWWYEQQVNRS